MRYYINQVLDLVTMFVYYSSTCDMWRSGVCYPSITHVSISTSSDYWLQELGLQLQLGCALLQTQDIDFSLLKVACEQWSSLPTARSLYLKAKHLLSDKIISECDTHLATLSVQSKFGDFTKLERSCWSWKWLVSGFHPGQLSVLLRAASDTLPTAVNFSVQSDAKCTLCNSTTAHILDGC